MEWKEQRVGIVIELPKAATGLQAEQDGRGVAVQLTVNYVV